MAVSRSYEVPLLPVMLSYDFFIIIYITSTVESNYLVTFKYIFKCSNVSNNLEPISTPL